MELVFATNNKHKLKELQAILGNQFSLLSLNEIGCTDEIPEDQSTLEGNARQKAFYVYNKYGYNCFADDTGLEIEALNDEPGVYSARYAGEEKSSEANMQKVLQKLAKINKRNARFRTVISLIINGQENQFEGIIDGDILKEKKGDSGFGYDPIFRPKGLDLSFAEMNITDKNKISHRARAVQKLVEYLKKQRRKPKKIMRKTILFLFTVIYALQLNAQRSMGTWQDYLSFINATKVAVSDEKVFCVTEGGLFYYSLQDNSVNKFSGVISLSDFGIKTIAFSKQNNVLIVAYKNSNIDLVYESGVVINLSDIKRKAITGDKTINNILFFGKEAYLACGFGIVVLNLDRQEVKDTYFIGEGGSSIAVNDIETDGQFFYAATDKGILKADVNGSNLLDYKNWNKIEAIPHSNNKFSQLAIHAGKLVANYTPDEYNQDELYILNGNNWSSYLPQINYAHDIQVNNDYLIVVSRAEVYVVNNSHSIIGMINTYQVGEQNIVPIKPRSAGISNEGSIWIADYENALIRLAGENFEAIFPAGPVDNKMFSMNSNGNDIWITPGGRNDSWGNTWQEPKIQLFRNGKWKYFTKNQYPELADFFDVVCVAIDPADPEHIFVGSWGGGILEFRGDEFISRYTHKNSPLQTALPPDDLEHYVRIGGLDFDSQGNLWITNSEVSENLVKLSPGGEWEKFVLAEVANNRNIGQVLVTKNDDKWILVPRGHDAYVVDKTGATKKRLLVTSYFNNGENEIFNRMNDVYSIAEDNEGVIWVGTSKGVAVYSNPTRIWDIDNFYASQPSLDLKDGLYHPLLETETVTAIAVDGANRKWLGTKNSGVYLISENGEEEVLHFTSENSPLLSNNITALTINQKNGEVFIGTDEGLISYMGDATGGNDAYENVYVFPNPVRETYFGPVTIAGLIENTDVKITDISGNLIFNTTSLGGQAVWDGNNLNGNRVKTGVYLVFCNDKSGEQTHIAKLLFIN